MISPSCCPPPLHERARPDPPPRSRPPDSYTTSRDTTNPRIASSLHQARKPRLIKVLTCLTMRHLCPIVRHRTPPETLRKLTGKSETRPENRRMTGKCFSGGPGEPSIRARSCARARKITELRVWAASPFSCRRRPPPASRAQSHGFCRSRRPRPVAAPCRIFPAAFSEPAPGPRWGPARDAPNATFLSHERTQF